MSSTLIALLDCNNFFVSCERLFRPDLINRPVIVLSSNDGCVVARSQEVKDMGIPMGVPYFKIKDILQKEHIEIFSGNLTLYRDISRRVFEVVRQEIGIAEQYSIDEAFFTIPSEENPQLCIERVKSRVEQLVGVPVSIGVAHSKTRAKYASSIAKKTKGLYVCDETRWARHVETIKLEQLWGVGAGMARKFREHGVTTAADLIRLDAALVQSTFGVVGRRLQSELQGIPAHSLEASRALQKSLMNSRSFSKTTTDKAVLADAAAYHGRHIAAELRSMQAACLMLRLSLTTSRHGNFFLRGGSQEAVFVVPTADTFVILEAIESLLESLYAPDIPYQKVGVTVSGIVAQTEQPATLFNESAGDNIALLQALDSLNSSAGKELITVGSRLRGQQWQAKAENRSPAYTTRWNDIATVSAKTDVL